VPPRGLEKELLEIKERLERRKEKRTQLQGELKFLLSQLNELGVSNEDEVEAKIKELQKGLKKLKRDLESRVERIQEQLRSIEEEGRR